MIVSFQIVKTAVRDDVWHFPYQNDQSFYGLSSEGGCRFTYTLGTALLVLHDRRAFKVATAGEINSETGQSNQRRKILWGCLQI
ncbi:MAG: hypothetical protein ACFB6S_14765 [Geminicoccaceae bacterium]